ncbi:MAG: phosphoribosylaminoimidazole-succinocarboxamide synthase [Clostridia bacterium]|jgi:phosphoribosylaminoimidazole-succinocarboxamide synthase|nr:phosphoribosylaminoimidazole-succinocarboxamide synthase [Clostridia bacterium]
MEKRELLYEGKAKRVYKTDDEKLYIVSYKDDATAFNGEKKGTIVGKGVVNNRMSNIMCRMLAENGIETHLVEELNDRETVVKAVQIVPLEVIVRNVAAGSFSKRFGVEEGTVLKNPTLEFCLKDDALGDPMINDYQILALDIATAEELKIMSEMTFKINELLSAHFLKIGVKLIDFKIELGRVDGKIILADEISPDTCRFWDAETNKKLDKDRFRRDLGGVEEVYQEMLERVTK